MPRAYRVHSARPLPWMGWRSRPRYDRPVNHLDATLQADGFVVARCDPTASTEMIAGQLGTIYLHPPASGRPSFDAVRALAPTESDRAAPRSYSARFGYNPFPLHTDLATKPEPPRWVLLRAVGTPTGVGTTLCDGLEVVRRVGVERCAHAIFRAGGGGPPHYLRMLDRLHDPRRLRWDQAFLQPANSAARHVQLAFAELAHLQHRVPLVRPDAVLVIDNWRMLHGREAVTEGDRGRLIERVYLQEMR